MVEESMPKKYFDYYASLSDFVNYYGLPWFTQMSCNNHTCFQGYTPAARWLCLSGRKHHRIFDSATHDATWCGGTGEG